MTNVELKIESFRLATLMLCQSATAGKGDEKPGPEKVMGFAKSIFSWVTEKDQ